MIRTLFLLILCLSLLNCFSQQRGKRDSRLPDPPNGVWMYENLFIDETEIANVHWLEFIHYLARDSSTEFYNTMLPDTTVWNNAADPYLEHYFRYPGYRFFPVVGVTREQAITYCKWRSDAVNQLSRDPERKKRLGLKPDQNVVYKFRLPTEQEWMYAASAERDVHYFPYGVKNIFVRPTNSKTAEELHEKYNASSDLKKFKEDFAVFFNSKSISSFNVLHQFKDYFNFWTHGQDLKVFTGSPSGNDQLQTRYIYEGIPNDFGLYNMIGNVAEIVQEPGVVKGGSWFHFASESRIDQRQVNVKPEAWLGFRCVCEVFVTDN